jgi:aspartate/methionine/tyrosine aminotransferase
MFIRPTNDNKSSADWKLDVSELERAITKKTKAILINTPQNVPGKVYTRYFMPNMSVIIINLLVLDLNLKALPPWQKNTIF